MLHPFHKFCVKGILPVLEVDQRNVVLGHFDNLLPKPPLEVQVTLCDGDGAHFQTVLNRFENLLQASMSYLSIIQVQMHNG